MYYFEDCRDQQQWTTDIQEVKQCSEVSKPVVSISQLALGKIHYLMGKIDTEWACDLIGKVEENVFFVEDISLFEQRVTSGSVDRIGSVSPRTIGVLHSHNTMGTFFSGVDQDYANSNHNLSGVVSGNRKYFDMKFTARVKLPCGKYYRADAPWTMQVEPVKVDTDKIKEKSYGHKKYRHHRPLYLPSDEIENGDTLVNDRINLHDLYQRNLFNRWPGNTKTGHIEEKDREDRG